MQNSSIGRKLMMVSKKISKNKQNVELVQKQQQQQQTDVIVVALVFILVDFIDQFSHFHFWVSIANFGHILLSVVSHLEICSI